MEGREEVVSSATVVGALAHVRSDLECIKRSILDVGMLAIAFSSSDLASHFPCSFSPAFLPTLAWFQLNIK
ncbi:hypothetical protein L1987_39510 [Smallanthus sonchifolius]|uniref:Uncharacterized protein n=1 Tax=Smallanthus sonchifolius TaxID=185202 RepID=A0ACB9HLM3_9ASTR|nr:hypothetical protein L1987_39510 [Smallanthus sonchifolius]